MKILIFGGSFNPFHDGHLFVIKNIFKKLEFDKIWILPLSKNPDKENILQLSNFHKLNIINLYLKNIKYTKIMLYELEKKGKITTYDTIKYFSKKYSEHDFTLVFGDDIKKNFLKWEKVNKLIKKVPIIFVNRNKVKQKIPNTTDIDLGFFNCESNKIRVGKYNENTNPLLIKYINDNILFSNVRINKWIKSKNRINHSYNVAEYGQFLATIHNLNITKVKTACLYHDLFKNITNNDEIKLLIKKYYFNNHIIKNIPKQALHGYFAAAYIKNEWKINDNKILNPIMSHTIPTLNMSKYDKLLYCADKLSKERKIKNIEKYRRVAKKSINKAFSMIFIINTKYLILKGFKIDRKYYSKLIKKYGNLKDIIGFVFFKLLNK